MIERSQIEGRALPFNVRYIGGKEPGETITVVGYGDAGLAPLVAGVENAIVHFEGGGWLWLPDLLRLYEIVEQ